MKKYLKLFLATSTFWACHTGNITESYPKLILQYNIEDIYDIAQYEIYKLSSNSECSCIGYSFKDTLKNDTFNILSLKLNLDTVYFRSDTTVFFFSFVNNLNKKIYYVNSLSNDCFQCVGIEVVGKSLYRAYFAESGYFFYENNAHIIPDSIFINKVKNFDPSIVNNNLKNIINKREMHR